MATNKTIGTLVFRIEADIKALRKDMAGISGTINKLKSSFGYLGAAAAGAFSVQNIARFTKEVITLASQAEGVRAAFEHIADPSLLQQLRDATRGTVSDLSLMQKAVQASNFQIPLKDLAALFEFATKRAQQTGQSVDYLVDSIVLGIGRKSPLILDNLGISAVRLRQELKGAGVEMTTVGDVAAAVGKIAQEEMGKAGEIIETTQIQSEKLKAAWANIKVVIGDTVKETFNLTEGFSSLSDVLNNMIERGTFEKITSVIAQWAKHFNFLALGLKATRAQFELYAKVFDKISGKQKAVVGGGAPVTLGGGGLANVNPLVPFMSGSAFASFGGPAPQKIQGKGYMPNKYIRGPASDIGLDVGTMQFDVSGLTGGLNELHKVIREKVKPAMADLGLVFQQTFMSAVDAFGSFVESLAAGELELSFQTILKSFGGFLSQMGKMIASYGIAALAFQNALINPVAAIVAGLALVAIGSAISGLASRGPSVGPSGGASGGYAAQSVQLVTAKVDNRYIYLSNQRGGKTMSGVT